MSAARTKTAPRTRRGNRVATLDRDYANRVLVLQGGGALGSYQGGVYEGLVDAGIDLNWVAGVSIGALNAALIAGNAPERRVERLHAFWDEICRQPVLPALPEHALSLDLDGLPRPLRQWMATVQSWRAMFEGQSGFFVPRIKPLPVWPGIAKPTETSYYDTGPLRSTLERLVDFDRINHADALRVSVGAVKVSSGELVYFDNREMTLGPEHFMASAALPPAFPAVEVGDDHYWDGGVIMNTPLIHVLMDKPQRDTLVFQVDLWNAEGRLPTSLGEVEERRKDILYASRTRVVTGYMVEHEVYRKAIADLLALVPRASRGRPAAKQGAELALDRRANVVQLICADATFEGDAKDYEFGRATMRRHWLSGMADLAEALLHEDWLDKPGSLTPFTTHGGAVEPAVSHG